MKTPTLLSLAVLCSLSAPVLGSTDTRAPGQQFNMNNWKITLPQDINKDGRVDEIEGVAMLTYSNDDFFHLDDQGHLVFEVQNQAITTKNSKNARSELRQMARGADFSIGTHDAKNNWALSSHPQADTFSAIGGTLEATLKVNHVSLHAKYPEKYPAFSVVVGQIHAEKDKQQIKDKSGFGHGNEPLKIFYKKFPGHHTGSVFWNYERNLAKNDPNRMDIAYPVWGNTWENPNDPGNEGVALGESFSYKVDVKGSMMHLTFTSDKHQTVTYNIDLSKGIDDKDNPQGYAKDAFYFKAGAYGQCSVNDSHPIWGPGCSGTGDFKTDKANGDYNSVSFSQLKLNGQ